MFVIKVRRDMVEVCVIDDGVGMSDEFCEWVIEFFYLI